MNTSGTDHIDLRVLWPRYMGLALFSFRQDFAHWATYVVGVLAMLGARAANVYPIAWCINRRRRTGRQISVRSISLAVVCCSLVQLIDYRGSFHAKQLGRSWYLSRIVNLLLRGDAILQAGFQHICWFSGLRGAIAFALALKARIDYDTRDLNGTPGAGRAIFTMTLVTVLFTGTFLAVKFSVVSRGSICTCDVICRFLSARQDIMLQRHGMIIPLRISCFWTLTHCLAVGASVLGMGGSIGEHLTRVSSTNFP